MFRWREIGFDFVLKLNLLHLFESWMRNSLKLIIIIIMLLNVHKVGWILWISDMKIQEDSVERSKHRTTNSYGKLGHCFIPEAFRLSHIKWYLCALFHNPFTFTWWILKKNSINWWSERKNLCRLSRQNIWMCLFELNMSCQTHRHSMNAHDSHSFYQHW